MKTDKKIDLCGLGNALVDILIQISDAELKQLGYEKASSLLVDSKAQQELLARFSTQNCKLISGGSVANSMMAFAGLGGRSAYITSLGDDRYGIHFKSEFDHANITLGGGLKANHSTGTCAALITHDAERTMRVDLGAAALLCKDDLDEELIASSRWLFVEGYVFGDPKGPEAIAHAVKLARRFNTKIAVTFSEAWVVESFGAALRDVVAQADLIFANQSEAEAFSGVKGAESAFLKLSREVPSVAITAGEHGAYFSHDDKQVHTPAFACEALDLTGAGDVFAAAILYGICSETPPEKICRAGNFLAMQIITRIGARLGANAKDYWQEALRI